VFFLAVTLQTTLGLRPVTAGLVVYAAGLWLLSGVGPATAVPWGVLGRRVRTQRTGS
jgi:hypothetical protein